MMRASGPNVAQPAPQIDTPTATTMLAELFAKRIEAPLPRAQDSYRPQRRWFRFRSLRTALRRYQDFVRRMSFPRTLSP